MKNKHFIRLTTAACLLISTFFIQLAAAQSGKISKTKPVACQVQKTGADFFVEAPEKTVKLKKGTLLSWTIFDMYQGLIVVKAKIGKKWTKGEILLDEES